MLCYGIHRTNFTYGGYFLFTHAPAGVTSIDGASNSNIWSVSTSRGSAETAELIYATNAYSKLILSETDGWSDWSL